MLLASLVYVLALQQSGIKEESFDLSSKFTGIDYRITVLHSGDTSEELPLLILLDAHMSLPLIKSLYPKKLESGEIEEAVIATIGYKENPAVNRWLDLTPTKSETAEEYFEPRMNADLDSGKADLFLRMLREEVIPKLESKYKTGSRHLWGHSFGGLFAGYALFKEPEMFESYGCSSPSFWWDDVVVSQYEEAYAKRESRPPARVFVSWGTKEGDGAMDATKTIVGKLEQRRFDRFTLKKKEFEGEDHGSVAHPALDWFLIAVLGN